MQERPCLLLKAVGASVVVLRLVKTHATIKVKLNAPLLPQHRNICFWHPVPCAVKLGKFDENDKAFVQGELVWTEEDRLLTLFYHKLMQRTVYKRVPRRKLV